MSNEPKWTAKIDQDNKGKLSYIVRKGEGCEGTFLAESKYFAEAIAEKLNRMDAEVQRLRIERDNALEGHKLITNAGNGLAKKLRESRAEVERLKGERDNAVKMCDSIYKVDKREIEQLRSDLARCKAERLGAEEIHLYNYWFVKNYIDNGGNSNVSHTSESITAFRASQQTQEGKG